jgi:hypothetical protein
MKNNELTTNDPRLRDPRGWRSGRPVEDPDKVKSWGFVTAKPSEHLIHVRGGNVTHRSGQGATCFKWPWDSVAIVPTSLQQLSFRADQVTAEKVGVEVVGLAVYRIADPLLAFRVLNFSYPERAQEKLEHTLTSMFVGATRRIVATLSVEDCLKKRKAALADELLREIAPVVGGRGSHDDRENVFAAMQAPFRAELEQGARVANALAQQTIAQRETSCRRETELARLAADDELAEREAGLRAKRALQQLELEASQARAAADAYADTLRAQEKQAELERQAAMARAELERIAAAADKDAGLARAAVALQAAEAAVRQADADARLEVAHQLPALAEALGKRIAEVKIVHVGGGDANPFAQLTGALGAIVDVARKA